MKNNMRVQSTNDFSTLSKVSAASLGYFPDDFQRHFVSRSCRRAPLIHRGYCVRSQAVSLCLDEFLEDTQECPQTQVLSLGCGFDSLFFRLRGRKTSAELSVWEVDFPEVAQRKRLVIEQTEVLSDLIGPHGTDGTHGALVLLAPGYRLMGVDLNDVSSLDCFLDGAGMRWDCPTLVLAEVALCYMDPARSTALIGWAAKRFATSSRFVLYEQSTPNDPFGQIMMTHFCSLNSPLHSVSAYPTLRDQRERFHLQGWKQCSVMDMNEFSLTCVAAAEKLRIDSLEPFDEFEEFHLKCSHYFILVASSGSLAGKPVLRPASSDCAELTIPPAPVISGSVAVRPLTHILSGLCRFGHRSCLTASQLVVTSGGFGEGDGKHRRLTDIHMLLPGGESWNAELTVNQWDGRLYHTVTLLSDGGELLVLGGRFSPTCAAAGALLLRYDKERVTVTQRDLQPDLLRWRHSAIEVSLSAGQCYVFVFGGRSVSSMAMQGIMFLRSDSLSMVELPVSGSVPAGRHSHSCCGWNGGAVLSGGLLRSGTPSGSITVLRPSDYHFQWEKLETTPPLTPRYSHSSHVVGDKLLLVGGIWFVPHSVPGLAVVDLRSGHCAEYEIDASFLEWPLMLHGHSSILHPDKRQILLLGGGGTCFSFGTHMNRQPVLLQLPVFQ
uniref:tRNA wybutosine-synthesizing protein 4 n=1 Tax=Leptobrachium leishanense TaxID=445787 RepID=A0A8C5PEY4_9ANUR